MKFKPCRQPQNGLFRPDKQYKKKNQQTQFSDFLVVWAQQGQTSVSAGTGIDLLTILA